jgi:hypothetical protein
MACEVAHSPFSEHRMGHPEETNLEAIADFNATFGNGTPSMGGHGSGINPQMLRNPPTPNSDYGNAFNPNAMEHTLSPQSSSLENYSPTINFAGTPESYFPSIEHPPIPFIPTSLRYETRRRSVSEPPEGLMHHHRYAGNELPQITFHRGGHYLGAPQKQRSLKSVQKSRQGMRPHPYKGKPSQEQQGRYQLRRANTQPVRGPHPTSAPSSMPMGPPPQPYPDMHMMAPPPHQLRPVDPLPVLPEHDYVSTRVCTPTPGPSQPMASPSQQPMIDPLLMPSPSIGSNAGENKTLSVPLTVDELKMMITEAVQKAVKGLEEQKEDVVPTTEQDPTQAVDAVQVAKVESVDAAGENIAKSVEEGGLDVDGEKADDFHDPELFGEAPPQVPHPLSSNPPANHPSSEQDNHVFDFVNDSN